MKRFFCLSLFLALAIGAGGDAAAASDKKPKQQKERPEAGRQTPSSFPETYIQAIDGERFRDPNYFRIMGGDGLRTADTRGLFQAVSQAVTNGQNYKALYLARLFTNLSPTLAQGWANRASIAATLNLAREAAICQAIAEHPGVDHPTIPDVLPGVGLSIRPKDLYDWAAAMALLADGLAAKFGPNQLAAIRDDVSGIHVSTQTEIADRGSPWAKPLPVLLSDIVPNLFSLLDATPMQYKTSNTGTLVSAMVLAGLSGLQNDAAAATQASEIAGEQITRAYSVPSHYTGGKFTAVTFPAWEPLQKSMSPRASGEFETVGGPLPLWWASGSSFSPTVDARIVGRQFSTYRLTPSDVQKGDPRFSRKNSPAPMQLHFPRLARLMYPARSGERDLYRTDRKVGRPNANYIGSGPVTLFEIMLTPEDLRVMFPNSQQIRGFSWTEADDHYARGDLVLNVATGDMRYVITNGETLANPYMLGYDDKGVAYGISPGICASADCWGSGAWLIPVAKPSAK